MTETTAFDTGAATAPDLRPQLHCAMDWVAGLVEATDMGRLDLPTPCVDYPVGDMLLHLTVVADKVVGLARDGVDPYTHLQADGPEALRAWQSRMRAERIEGRPAAEIATYLRERAAQVQREWTDERMSAPVTLGWGPVVPGAAVVSIYLFEIVAHGWDLAQATGQDCEAPVEVAEAALAAAHSGLPPEMPRGMANGVPFEAEVTPPEGAGPTTRMACFLGRTPLR